MQITKSYQFGKTITDERRVKFENDTLASEASERDLILRPLLKILFEKKIDLGFPSNEDLSK